MRRQIPCLAAALGFGAWLTPATAAAQRVPELILYNGHIVTVDARFSSAEAVGIAGGRFVAVGRSADVRALKASSTREIDLRGRTVVPGFIDAHAHYLTRVNTAQPSLEGLTSVQAIAEAVARTVGATPAGRWIVTSPIGEDPDYFGLPESLAEKRWPTRGDLDRAAPNHPVYIPTPGTWPHPAVFNSAALRELGISSASPSEEGGVRIQKDRETGEPTGLVDGLHFYNRSSSLFRKLQPFLPRPSSDATLAAMREAMKVAHSVGLTTVYEAHGTRPSQLVALRRLWSDDELSMRVGFSYDVDASRSHADLERWMRDDLAHLRGGGFGDERLKLIGVTVGLDGAAQFGATLMNAPYRDPSGRPTSGTEGVSADTLSQIAVLAAKHDLRLNVTFAGDKAADLTLAAFEAANRQSSIQGKRWLLQHMQHPTPEQIARVKALDAVVSTYTSVDFSKGAAVYVDRFDGDVWKTVVPMRQWLDAGVLVAQSTDGAHFEPLFTLWESLVRVDGRTGRSLLTPEKTITREEALRIYTINGAKVLFWEDQIGSIEPGKLADLVVLDRDVLTCPLEEIRDTKVLMTMWAGKTMYDVR